ncbi:MAG: APC family permease [Nanoarchaeota archaeon]|nr:APC family permease [Nanoarchaeota archaeon]
MTKLKRELGLFQVTAAGVGIILGAGIYALIGVAAGGAGNATWLAFLFSAFIALLSGLSYAELSSMFKGNAGEFDYIKAAFNKKLGLVVALSVIFASIITSAAVSLGFAGYFIELIPIPYIAAALLLIILMSIINFIGIKEASWFNTISTFIEFGGLILIIILGIKYFGSVNYFELPSTGIMGVFSTTALVFFAYLGFDSIIKLSEETKNPQKTLPIAIILSILITSIVYVLVAISAVSVVGWETLSQSKAPLALVAQTALGGATGPLLAVIALFSTANTVLISMLTASRQVYGIAKQKSLPKIFALVHKKTQTPWLAILLITIFSLLFTLIGDIGLVANITNLLLFITFAMVNLSLIVLRYKCEGQHRGFRCPGNIKRFSVVALLGFLTSIFMIGIILKDFFF